VRTPSEENEFEKQFDQKTTAPEGVNETTKRVDSGALHIREAQPGKRGESLKAVQGRGGGGEPGGETIHHYAHSF